MSDEQGGEAAPDTKDGLNIPNAVEELLARVEAIEAWKTGLEARIDQLGGN